MAGNLDEGEPYGLPGSYLNGVFEIRPLPYAERGYGNPESGQTIINVTNGKVIRLLVNDEPFDVRYGELRSHERCLDFRGGVLGRQAEWSRGGLCGQVTSTRMVSLTQRSIAAICYEVEPVNQTTRIVVQSELVANEQLPVPGRDPRAPAALTEPLVEQADASGRTRWFGAFHPRKCPDSGRGDGPRGRWAARHAGAVRKFPLPGSDDGVHHSGTRAAAAAHQGRRVRVVRARSLPAVRDQADAALAGAMQTGWEGLLAEQRSYLDRFWACADVELDGHSAIQQAVRFGLFHLAGRGAQRAERSRQRADRAWI